jgi:hypothetical protein
MMKLRMRGGEKKENRSPLASVQEHLSQPEDAEDEEKERKKTPISRCSKWGIFFPKLRMRKKKENRSPLASVPSGPPFSQPENDEKDRIEAH